MKSSVVKLIDNMPKLMGALNHLMENEALVGVPSETTERKPDANGNIEETPINNAALAYIHDNGSPARNIPARPFMKPGIAAAKSALIKHFKIMAKRAINGSKNSGDLALYGAGIIAQRSIRAVLNSGIEPELSERTIKARIKRGRKGTKPLVDTGQLRNSINFVIRKNNRQTASHWQNRIK